jgi:putative transcriptional regulator
MMVTIRLMLSEIREKRGLTQEELAQSLNMSLGGVQYLEYSAKAIKFDLMDRICSVLDCDPGDLFKRIDDSPNETDRDEQRQQKSERMKAYWKKRRKENPEREAVAS